MTTIAPPTPDMLAQFEAFGPVDMRPVRIKRDIKTRAGNILIAEGTVTWANFAPPDFEPTPGFVSVWTADTHYAGCKSSSVPITAVETLDG
jgi:hypothetical protein